MDKMKVCHDVLRAENQPFADERDKKKFLDLVEEQKKEKELDIFAFWRYRRGNAIFWCWAILRESLPKRRMLW